jgi:hypothetical protein
MPDFSLVPVDHQPDFENVSLVPVDHDPFAADNTVRQTRLQLATQPLETGAVHSDLGAQFSDDKGRPISPVATSPIRRQSHSCATPDRAANSLVLPVTLPIVNASTNAYTCCLRQAVICSLRNFDCA